MSLRRRAAVVAVLSAALVVTAGPVSAAPAYPLPPPSNTSRTIVAGLVYGGSTAGAVFQSFTGSTSISVSTSRPLVPTVCGFGPSASVTVSGQNPAGATGTVGTFTADSSNCVTTGAFRFTRSGTYTLVFASSTRRVAIQVNASSGTQAGIGLPQTGFNLLPVAGGGLLLLLMGSVLLLARRRRSGRHAGRVELPQS